MTTIPLKEPIKFGTETIPELVLRPPKAKDFRKFPASPTTGDMLDLAGQLAGQPKQVIDELGVDDMMRVLEEIGIFLQRTPGTGLDP